MRIPIPLTLVTLAIAATAWSQQPQLLGTIPSDTINSLFGTEIIPLGDQNGDGYDDLLVWDFRFRGQLFLGGPTVTQTSVLTISPLGRPQGLFRDVDNDGFADLYVQSRPGSPNRLELYLGGPSIDSIPDFYFGIDSLSGVHISVVLGQDVTGDGNKELITQKSDFSPSSIVIYELSSFQLDSVPDMVFGPPGELPTYSSFGDRITTGDFNGDGWEDLTVNWRPVENTISGAALIYFGGPIFDSLPDLIIRRPSGFTGYTDNFARQVMICPGDINGDGWDDLIIGSSLAFDDTLTFVYFGGPELDTLPDLTVVELIDLMGSDGDVNNDGYHDFLAGRPYSFGGFVSLYYGGPDLDSLNDMRIWDSDLTGFTTYVGMDVTGIGDYNGDGIDDFAFSAVNGQKGTVYIYAGFQDATDVPFDYEPTLPSGYELVQNYPNPFNPATTISFSVPVAGETELAVYNILGERVTLLISRQLAAGSYTVEWDGMNANGDAVASGVYVYRLQSGNYTTSRKMILAR